MTAMWETEVSRTKFQLRGTVRVTDSCPSPSPRLLSFLTPAALALPAHSVPHEGAASAHPGEGLRVALPAVPREVGRKSEAVIVAEGMFDITWRF